MFSRFFTLFPITVLAAVATAMPSVPEARGGSQCNTGSTYCCNQALSASSTTVSSLSGLLGIVLGDVTALVGLNCNSIVGVLSSSSCTQEPVCCTGNNYSGLIVVGCSPINL